MLSGQTWWAGASPPAKRVPRILSPYGVDGPGGPSCSLAKIPAQQTTDGQQTPRLGVGLEGMTGLCRALHVGPTTGAKMEQDLLPGPATG